jgi:LytS/YehU family sensor histidine kinase
MRKERFAVWKREQRVAHDFNIKLANSEITALRAQMNPHFIFNCMNSINRYIIKSEPEKASSYLTGFARLVRLVLENSVASKISLDRELESITLYLQMEALRFEKKLEFKIMVDDNIDRQEVFIPPLIFQAYVENSIWHGLLHKDGGGLIKIMIESDQEYLICIIEDNGIGRDKARALRSKADTSSKSFGMQITSERINYLTIDEGHKASVEIVDLKDKTNDATGTRVIIRIPHASTSSQEESRAIT